MGKGPGLVSRPNNPYTEALGRFGTTDRGRRRHFALEPPPPRGMHHYYRPRDMLTQLTSISLVHSYPTERTHKHAVGGISPSYAGHVPGARHVYGTSARGGLPFREEANAANARPYSVPQYNGQVPNKVPPARHPTSSSEYGRQAWLDGRPMNAGAAVGTSSSMFDGRGAKFTQRAPVRI